MRVATKIAAVAAAAATVLAVGIGPAAQADPETTPSLTTLAGVGSDTITPLFSEGGVWKGDQTSSTCTASGPESGTFAHDYNATKPTYKIASWDAVDPCTGATATITTKAKNSSDTSCQLTRPDGSSDGIEALNDNQTDTNTTSTGQTVYCVDFARSSRAPNTTTFEDAFAAMSQDAITWTSPKVSGESNPEPTNLTQAQLEAIYTCTDTNWDQVGGKDAPIGVVVPQSGSGTRSTWLLALGITASSEPCWQNGTVVVDGVTDVIEENTGLSPGNVAQFTKTQDFGTTCASGCKAADDIYPYSIGDWIAQDPVTDGVGGHATSIWGHGNMHVKDIENAAGTKAETPVTTKSSGAPQINPNWNPAFDRILYVVTRNGCYVSSDPTSTDVCLPSRTPPAGGTVYPTYEVTGLKAFIDWACDNATAKADTTSYGFTNLSSKTLITKCGDLTAGD
jgi:ABC-type phosphate transport system substrate-binding protein